MPPLEPILETLEAVDELDPSPQNRGLLERLTDLANRAQEIVPDLVGVSLAPLTQDLTFTLVATGEEIALLDAVQYAAGGPCVAAAQADNVIEFDNDDPLDEERWRLFAQASAARAVGSTLTLPMVSKGRVVGTVNLYATAVRAFSGQHDQLASLFGAWAPGAVVNADLSFSTRRTAQAAPGLIRDQVAVEVAAEILAVELAIDADDAERRLRDAAERAGISAAELARAVARIRDGRGPDEA